MKLAEAIKVRLTEGQAARYAAEADSRGVAISTYIRERLEEADNRGEELAGIRAALIDLGDVVDELRDDRAGRSDDRPAQGDAGSTVPQAVQIEMLLLLRAIAGPQKMQMARGEVERQGYTPWAGTEDRNAPGR